MTLVGGGRCHVRKKDWISKIRAGPIVFQLEWKNLAEKPSGPGALSGCMRNITCFTSAASGIEQILSFVVSEIDGVIADVTITVVSAIVVP